MGGPSSERDVSLMSGSAIAEGLTQAGHRVTRADISPGDLAALDRPGIDVVFIALHGAFGEDGGVQQLCEDRHLRYIGSDPASSALAMDKVASRKRFAAAGLAVPKDLVFTPADADHQREAINRLGLPVVLKPVDGGSSVDITIAKTPSVRDAAVAALLDKYGRALAEEFVVGREFTVGILGRRPLPVLEIVPAREFYDYAAKYADDSGTRYIFDHGLPGAVVRSLQASALAAHEALGCRDLSRVDFIVTPGGLPVVLEVNTIPGFTSHSLVPMAAAKAGLSFSQLVDRIVIMAMQR
jgi:D-alanine-D-alanine ligase